MTRFTGVLFLSLFSLCVYALGENTRLTGPGLTLDLVEVDEGQFRVSSAKNGHVLSQTFTAPEEETIEQVTFGSETLWRAGAGRRASFVHLFFGYGEAKLAVVFRGTHMNPVPFFFVHEGDSWNEVGEEVYTAEFKKLWTGALSSATVDVTTPEASFPPKHEEFSGSVLYRNFAPPEGKTITSVVDGTQIIWEPTDDVMGPSDVYVYYHNGEAVLVYIYLKEGIPETSYLQKRYGRIPKYEYFGKVRGLWRTLLPQDFTEKFNELKKDMRKDIKGALTVNVLDMHDSGVQVTKAPTETQPFLEFSPLSETKITKVVAGTSTIWAGSSLSCVAASVLFKEEEPILAELTVMASEEKKLYLEKRTFGWYPVGKEEFEAKVQVAGFATLSIFAVAAMLAFSMEL